MVKRHRPKPLHNNLSLEAVIQTVVLPLEGCQIAQQAGELQRRVKVKCGFSSTRDAHWHVGLPARIRHAGYKQFETELLDGDVTIIWITDLELQLEALLKDSTARKLDLPKHDLRFLPSRRTS